MKITHLLLDADHVIINKPALWSEKYCREFNVPYEEVLPFFQGPFQDCLIGKADLKQQLNSWLIKWGWPYKVDAFLEYWFKAEHYVDAEILEVIEQIRDQGIFCAVATNQEKYRTKYLRTKMGFDRQFDKIFSSCEIGAKKPQIEFFEKIWHKINQSDKNKVIFWDNDEENVTTARAFGINAEVYRDIDKFKKAMEQLI